MAFTHTKKVDIASFIKARIRIRPKRSGSDRIRIRNTALGFVSPFNLALFYSFWIPIRALNECGSGPRYQLNADPDPTHCHIEIKLSFFLTVYIKCKG
jgi:hypothetical protein